MAAKLKTTEPKLEQREAQHYAGIRTQVPFTKLSKVIPTVTEEIIEWLDARDIPITGPSIVRYHVINMADKLDIEMGMIVDKPFEGDDRVKPGVLPAGNYASLVYTGVRNGRAGNGALIDWAMAQGLQWDRWDDPKGDAFASRYEALLSEAEGDMATWETVVAIKVKD